MVTHFSFLIIMEGLEPISQLTKTGTMVISTVQQESFEGENFCETDDFLQIARFCRTKRHHAPKFAEKTFTADTQKTAKFAKVFSFKSSCYTVC